MVVGREGQPHILTSVEARVGWIRFNRPDKLNPVGLATREELYAAVAQFARDDVVRCLVIIGSGRAFSAGADVREFPQRSPKEIGDALRERYRPLLEQLRVMPKPVICGLNGLAAGIATSLALACDIRIAAEDCYLYEAFASLGLGPDGGASWMLPRFVGRAKALEMFFLGDPLSAIDAERFGLVNRVVPKDRVEDECRKLAQRLSYAAPGAVESVKRTVAFAETSTFAEAVEFESHLQEARLGSEDFKEGVTAFLEKRKPDFKGR